MIATPHRTALAIDIGGTRVRSAVVDAVGKILTSVEGRLPPDGDPAPLCALIAEQAALMRTAAPVEPSAVGIALPGLWDRDSGVMQRAVNLPKLEGVNIRALFTEALGPAPYLESDVNAALWGQWQHMTPRPRRLVYLSLGTGVGGGVLLDGEIVRHTRGGAGHFGFLIVDTAPDAPAGRNHIPGCLSALVAGPALHLAATGQPDIEAIGDEPLPETVQARAAQALAVACVQLTHIYAPELIALGGGVIDHHPQLVNRTADAFARYQSPLIPRDLRIVRAPLATHEAGVIGAGLLALHAQP